MNNAFNFQVNSVIEMGDKSIEFTVPTFAPYGHKPEIVVVNDCVGYIPIPKNASTSIRDCLQFSGSCQRVFAKDCQPPKEFFAEQISRLDSVFTVIRRDHETRLLSGINEFLKRELVKYQTKFGIDKFDDQTVYALLSQLPVDEHTTPQTLFLSGIDLDTVEIFAINSNLETNISKLLAQQGISAARLPVMNKTNLSAITETQALIDRLGITDRFNTLASVDNYFLQIVVDFTLRKLKTASIAKRLGSLAG